MSRKRCRTRASRDSALGVALRVLERVDRDSAFARAVLDAELSRGSHLEPAERRLVTRIVRGTLQWRLQIDHFLERLLPRGLARTDRRVRWVLRVGAFGVLHQDGLPAAVAVNCAVALAREHGRVGLAGLVNASLRRLASQAGAGRLPMPDPISEPDAHLAVAAALPLWLAGRWLGRFGQEEALELGLSLNRAARLCVRVQPPADTEEVLLRLKERGLAVTRARRAPDCLVLGSPGPLGELDEVARGQLFVQDEASILVGHLVAAQRGWQVLDCCAAPGGKAAQLAAMVGPRGMVHARDLGPGRVRLLGEVSSKVPMEVEERDLLAPPSAGDLGRFDAVLLDAPCSNIGTLRRHPELKARIEELVICLAAARQAQMIRAAAMLVRPGGLLVYSVCSLAPEEGWGVVEPFLGSEVGRGFRIEAPSQEGLFEGLEDSRGAVCILPHRHDMDGFFALRLRRS